MIIMLKKLDISQNPYIGVLAVTNDKITLVPEHIEEQDIEIFQEALDTVVCKCNFGGLSLLGSLSAMNSNGMIVPSYVEIDEIEFGDEFRIMSDLDTRYNAFGNNILVNDNFALVFEEYTRKTRRDIADILDVEVEKGVIADFKTIGSVAVATNKGLLAHPLTSPEELEYLKSAFGVPGDIGTANFGVGQVGACMIANSKGAVAGVHSTGIELGRIEDALRIY